MFHSGFHCDLFALIHVTDSCETNDKTIKLHNSIQLVQHQCTNERIEWKLNSSSEERG